MIDVDTEHGGAETLQALLREFGSSLLDTVVAETGGGGLHLYFKAPQAFVAKVGRWRGIDVRSGNTYVVAPPSRHVRGTQYRWRDGHSPAEREVAPLPREVAARLREGSQKAASNGGGRPIPEGQRNDTLAREAGALRHRGWTVDEITAALEIVNLRCQPPLPPAEVRKIAESIGRYPPAEPAEPDGTAAATLRFMLTSEILQATPEAVSWLWEGYVAEGAITLVAGAPKAGKSTLLCALLAALTSGSEFLGRPTHRTRAIVLTEERTASFAAKLRQWRLGDDVTTLFRHEAFRVPWPEVVRQAIRHARNVGAKVLAVDTLAEWSQMQDENDAAGALVALQPLREAAAAGLGVIVQHHQRKTPGEFGQAVRGSSAIIGGVDVIIELERPPHGIALPPTVRVLRGLGRFGTTPEELVVALRQGGYELYDRPLPAVEAEAEREAILAFLAETGEATADQVAEAVGLPKPTAHHRLEYLQRLGTVLRTGGGRRGDPYRWSLRTDSFRPV